MKKTIWVFGTLPLILATVGFFFWRTVEPSALPPTDLNIHKEEHAVVNMETNMQTNCACVCSHYSERLLVRYGVMGEALAVRHPQL